MPNPRNHDRIILQRRDSSNNSLNWTNAPTLKSPGPPSPPSLEKPDKMGDSSVLFFDVTNVTSNSPNNVTSIDNSLNISADLRSIDLALQDIGNYSRQQIGPLDDTIIQKCTHQTVGPLDDTIIQKKVVKPTNAGPLDDTVIVGPDESSMHVKLQNSQAEVQRLQRVLEDEMTRSAEQRAKLEAEVREYRKLTRLTSTTAVRSPPSAQRRRDSHAGNATATGGMTIDDHYLPVSAYVIGLTGNLASGKTTACEMLSRLGATVIDADALALELQQKGQETYEAIVDLFGPGILDNDGEINRERLRRLVFGDKRKLRSFEKLMHRAIHEASLERMQRTESHVVVYKARKLLSAGHFQCNAVWVLVADTDTQLQRLVARGMTVEEAQSRIRAQPAQQDLVGRATALFDTSFSDLDALKGQMVRWWALIPQPSSNSEDYKVLARLVSLDSSDPHVELLSGADIVFGRAATCHVQVADVTVSHEQCRIWGDSDQRFWLDDLSTHGTYVNFKRVGKGMRVPLVPGDAISLSKVAAKNKTLVHSFVFQRSDSCTSRTVQFPCQHKVLSVQADRWVERESESHPGMIFWVNLSTGVTSVNPPH